MMPTQPSQVFFCDGTDIGCRNGREISMRGRSCSLFFFVDLLGHTMRSMGCREERKYHETNDYTTSLCDCSER